MSRFIALWLLSCIAVTAASPSAETIDAWQSRKFGMFIHFGLYSTLGGVWKGRQYSGNYSEQIQSDAHIPEAEYAALASTFNPTAWNPDAIVQLALDAGMKFIVITAKHHDGFNLFETHQTTFNSIEAAPYHRDIVKSLADACARRGMPFGVYYSTIDWHFGDVKNERNDNPLSAAHEQFNVAQLHELLSGYGPLTEIWFDMGHPTPLQSAHFAETVHELQPQCMISGRIWNNQGDFSETGDDEIPDYTPDRPWESPASIFADTWGYRSWEKRSDVGGKTQEEILRLVKVVSRGGNYILNIGPRGDGSVVPYEADVLHGVGQWLQQNGQAIYGTQAQPFRKLSFGYATVKEQRLYLFVEHMPPNGRLELPGLISSIRSARWLGDGAGGSLRVEASAGGRTLIAGHAPASVLPVAVVDFDGPLQVVAPAVQSDAANHILLRPSDAERFYNSNGEGYWDHPTVRSELWHFAVKRAGSYRVQLHYKPGPVARLFDVQVGAATLQTVVYSSQGTVAVAGTIDLPQSQDVVLRVSRAQPAEPAAALDIEFSSIELEPQQPATKSK